MPQDGSGEVRWQPKRLIQPRTPQFRACVPGQLGTRRAADEQAQSLGGEGPLVPFALGEMEAEIEKVFGLEPPGLLEAVGGIGLVAVDEPGQLLECGVGRTGLAGQVML